MDTKPQKLISQLSMLSNAKRKQLLYEFNNTAIEFPSDLCVYQLFEEQVKKIPDAIAVVFKEQHLTYQQLDKYANQLAHYLRSLGVVPEVIVGVCMERSLETIIGLLGILKSGGAYLPLDPSYPQERLAFMLEDSSVSIVISQKHLFDQMLFTTKTQILCMDS